MRCLTLRSRRWGSYWGSQGQGGPRKWRQRPGEGSLSPEGDCGRKAVNARKAYLEHAEVCGFPFLDFPPVLQSEGQDPRLEGHWNLRLEYIHWAAGFVDWPSTAINLAKMQFFFSATVFQQVHKTIAGHGIIGLVCKWLVQNVLCLQAAGGKKSRVNTYY